jgi:hypothetical protein
MGLTPEWLMFIGVILQSGAGNLDAMLVGAETS